LNGKLDGADERWKQLDQAANAIAEKFAHLGETLPLDRLLPEHGLSWPRSLSGESWRWRFPETGPRLPVAAPNLPRTGVPDWGRLDGWRALWMLVILTALGLILWKTVRHAPLRGVSASDSWKLGPWPVQPTAVQTREQLIQAFEYLSLLHLGPAARHWHHWTIARGLGQSAGNPAIDRRRAAEQLAFLYEQARYAPAAEPLPETALATARRDLCLLAGVSVS